MLKIIAKSKYTFKRRHETIDCTLDRAEADFLVAEYRLAFGPEWEIGIMATPGHETLEQVAELRRQGLTNGQIVIETGLTRFTVDQYTAKLAKLGVIEKRKAGGREKLVDRNNKMIELRKSGRTTKEIAAELKLEYYTVRSKLYELRKQGRL